MFSYIIGGFKSLTFLRLMIVGYFIIVTLPAHASNSSQVKGNLSKDGKGDYTLFKKGKNQCAQYPNKRCPLARGGNNLDRNAEVKISKGKLTLTCPDPVDNKPGQKTVTSQNSPIVLKTPCPRVLGSKKGTSVQYRRGGQQQSIPYVVSPRYTRINTLMPTFKWNNIPNVSSYKLILHGGLAGEDNIIWEKIISSNDFSDKIKIVDVLGVKIASFPYPSDTEKPLNETGIYNLEVIATMDDGTVISSSENIDSKDYPASSRFGISTSRKNPGHLKFGVFIDPSIPVKDETTDSLAYADLLVSYDMYEEAIDVVENLGTVDNRSSVFRQLGDLYSDSGLNTLAKAAYREARKNLKAPNLDYTKEDLEAEIELINMSESEIDKLLLKQGVSK
jgi:hypothetical protein